MVCFGGLWSCWPRANSHATSCPPGPHSDARSIVEQTWLDYVEMKDEEHQSESFAQEFAPATPDGTPAHGKAARPGRVSLDSVTSTASTRCPEDCIEKQVLFAKVPSLTEKETAHRLRTAVDVTEVLVASRRVSEKYPTGKSQAIETAIEGMEGPRALPAQELAHGPDESPQGPGAARPGRVSLEEGLDQEPVVQESCQLALTFDLGPILRFMTNALAICKAPATDVSELEVMGDRGAQQPQQPLMLGGGPEHYLVLPELMVSLRPFLQVKDLEELRATCHECRQGSGNIFHTTEDLILMMIHGTYDEKVRACKCLMKCDEYLGHISHRNLRCEVETFYRRCRDVLTGNHRNIVRAARKALSKHRLKREGVHRWVHELLHAL